MNYLAFTLSAICILDEIKTSRKKAQKSVKNEKKNLKRAEEAEVRTEHMRINEHSNIDAFEFLDFDFCRFNAIL